MWCASVVLALSTPSCGTILVDELQLYVNPGVAGEGSRIFDRTMATEKYQLANAIPTTCGILIGCWTKWRRSQDAEAGNAS